VYFYYVIVHSREGEESEVDPELNKPAALSIHPRLLHDSCKAARSRAVSLCDY
jgi:hypothetical protein